MKHRAYPLASGRAEGPDGADVPHGAAEPPHSKRSTTSLCCAAVPRGTRAPSTLRRWRFPHLGEGRLAHHKRRGTVGNPLVPRCQGLAEGQRRRLDGAGALIAPSRPSSQPLTGVPCVFAYACLSLRPSHQLAGTVASRREKLMQAGAGVGSFIPAEARSRA